MKIFDTASENEFTLEISEEEKRIILWFYKTSYTGEELKTEDEQINWSVNEILRKQLERWKNESAEGQRGKRDSEEE